MERNNITNKSTSTTIACCVFFLFGIFFFSFIFFDLDFLFSVDFPILIFFPILFIGIFIPISAALRSNRQRQNFTPTSYKQQSQQSQYIQSVNSSQKQYLSKTEEKPQDYYCKYCGEKIKRNSIYCPQCGTRLKQ